MKDNFSTKQLRIFGYLIGFGFPIVMGWLIPKIIGHVFRSWTLLLGIPFLIIGIFKPRLLFYPYKLWIEFGNKLSWFNTKIILIIIFLFVVQPTALIMRLTGYDPLRKRKGPQKTYREVKKNQKLDLRRMF